MPQQSVACAVVVVFGGGGGGAGAAGAGAACWFVCIGGRFYTSILKDKKREVDGP